MERWSPASSPHSSMMEARGLVSFASELAPFAQEGVRDVQESGPFAQEPGPFRNSSPSLPQVRAASHQDPGGESPSRGDEPQSRPSERPYRAPMLNEQTSRAKYPISAPYHSSSVSHVCAAMSRELHDEPRLPWAIGRTAAGVPRSPDRPTPTRRSNAQPVRPARQSVRPSRPELQDLRFSPALRSASTLPSASPETYTVPFGPIAMPANGP